MRGWPRSDVPKLRWLSRRWSGGELDGDRQADFERTSHPEIVDNRGTANSLAVAGGPHGPGQRDPLTIGIEPLGNILRSRQLTFKGLEHELIRQN